MRPTKVKTLCIIALALSASPVGSAYCLPLDNAPASTSAVDARLAPKNQVLLRSSLTRQQIEAELAPAFANLFSVDDLRGRGPGTSVIIDPGTDDKVDDGRLVQAHRVNAGYPVLVDRDHQYFDFEVIVKLPHDVPTDIRALLLRCLGGECTRLGEDSKRLVEPNWYQFRSGVSDLPGVARRCKTDKDAEEDGGCGLGKINLPTTPASATGVIVGIPDTGGVAHKDLPKLQYLNGNDVNGHGTHLAGIIGAARDGFGIVGVAPDAKLVAWRFLDANGRGTATDAIQALTNILNRSPHVVLVAWGTTEITQDLCAMLQLSPNVLFVAAAGNLNQDLGKNPIYPAACSLSSARTPNVISVMASTCNGTKAIFSNKGADISAPGDDPGNGICSTVLGQMYGRMSGTSVAAAYVAGAAALVKYKTPSLDGAAMKSILVGSEGQAPCAECAGMLDVTKALANASASQVR